MARRQLPLPQSNNVLAICGETFALTIYDYGYVQPDAFVICRHLRKNYDIKDVML
jgi:hypothetical protein